MTPKGLARVSLTFCPNNVGKPLMNFSFQNGVTIASMHDFGGEHIFLPPVFSKVLTSKVTQLVVNPRCDVARFSYEVFHDRIDQGIDSVKNTSSYAFIKDRVFFLIFLDNMFVVFLRLFC